MQEFQKIFMLFFSMVRVLGAERVCREFTRAARSLRKAPGRGRVLGRRDALTAVHPRLSPLSHVVHHHPVSRSFLDPPTHWLTLVL